MFLNRNSIRKISFCLLGIVKSAEVFTRAVKAGERGSVTLLPVNEETLVLAAGA